MLNEKEFFDAMKEELSCLLGDSDGWLPERVREEHDTTKSLQIPWRWAF